MVKITEVAEWRKGYAKVVAKAWSDLDFKAQLLRDPRATLAAEGLDVPTSFDVSVVEDSAEKRHLVLPVPPADCEISEESLAGVAGGACCTEGSCTST